MLDSDITDALAETLGQIDREKQATDAMAAVEKARFRAVGERHPARCFFSKLALDLEARVDWDAGTAYTDGKVMAFSPAFINCLTPDEVHGVVIGHEPMHDGFLHFDRGRKLFEEDSELANIAADLEINPKCIEAGFVLPKIAIFPGKGQFAKMPPGLTMEEYYYRLRKEAHEGSPAPGEGEGGGDSNKGDGQGDTKVKPGNDPGGCGGFRPAPDDATTQARKAAWQGKVAAAAQSMRGKGDLPGFLQAMINDVLKPKRDPWGMLQEHLTRLAKTDLSWLKPNRRTVSQGLWLPARHGYALGNLALLVDCSGSIGDDDMRRMAGLMESLLGLNPGKLTIIYHTTVVTHVEEWTPDDGELKIERHGCGGTSHRDAFAEIFNMGVEPAVIIALTDLETTYPEDPGCPVLWVDVSTYGYKPPFGKVVCVAE